VKLVAERVAKTLYDDENPTAALTLALAFAIAFAAQRRIKIVVTILVVFAAGLSLEKSVLLHYAAPGIPAVMLLAMQGTRIIRFVKVGSQSPGLRLIAIMFFACAGLTTLQVVNNRESVRSRTPKDAIQVRWAIERQLNSQPGRNVVVVRYSPNHALINDEIVYNGPDIDAQKIVWAIDRGTEENRRLTEYYRGRQIWLLQPDPPNVSLTAYPE
jgi:hypothetical protein